MAAELDRSQRFDRVVSVAMHDLPAPAGLQERLLAAVEANKPSPAQASDLSPHWWTRRSLVAALGSPAFYVGCLGSKKTHDARRVRLGAHRISTTALDRLRGPVGLRIGARTPPEIAVSILAEIVAALRGAA